MDSSSWIHGNHGGGGFMCGYAGRCTAEIQYREQDELLVSSEIQQHLNQIHMKLNMDDDEPAAAYSRHGSSVVDFPTNSYHATGGCSFPSSSSISFSFRSASSCCSPETSSTAAHVLLAPATTGHQFPDVSSSVAPGGLVLLPYDDQDVANFHLTPAAMTSGGMSSTSAFRRYDRQLVPQRRLTPPACGQRMFKTAMSVLAKMQTAMRYSHQQQQQQQQQASAAEPLGHQLQHLISERRRRQKLNDSFRALKTVLPLGPKSKKSGQASILIAAREYVNSLKSKLCELEEKNEALQLELARHATSAEEDGAGEKVEIQKTIDAAAEDHQTGEVCTVKIWTPARGNTTDVVLRILQRLKDLMGENVSLMSMSTGEDGDGPRRASLTLQLKSASDAKWEEEAVREAVTKAVTSPSPAGLGGAE